MAYGSVNGGGPGGGVGPMPPTSGQGTTLSKNVESKIKTIAYGTSDQVYSVTSSASVSAPSGVIPEAVRLQNNGFVPLTIMAGYKSYSTETAIANTGATRYFHTMLMPGESYSPSVRGVISTATATTQFDGTAVENTAPDSNEYTVSGTSVNAGEGGDHVINSTSATNLWLPEGDWTDPTNGPHLLFRVGDLIRVNDEIMEVTAVGSGADGTNNNYLTVLRGQHGSTAATHTAGNPIRFPFYNAHHDYDRYSVAQTDGSGRFKSYNFFGLSRTASGASGLVPGSLAIKFYEPGYQSLGRSGILPSTNTGLAASTAYEFDIQVDGGTNFDNLSFTTDSSDVTFRGVIQKIQEALNTQYYTSGNLFEKKVVVSLTGGDVRFTSGSRLSTSAILLTAGSTGAAEFFGTGRIPAVAGTGQINSPVAAKLPDDSVYDKVTYATSPTSGAFAYDDGRGRILGPAAGEICYERGMIDFVGPPNAEFVYSISHTSAFSGKLTDATTARGGSLVDILVNCPSQKRNGSISITVFGRNNPPTPPPIINPQSNPR